MRTLARFTPRSAVAAVAIACTGMFGLPAPAAAQAGGPGAEGSTAPTASRNIYAAGGQVRPTAPVAGDFTAAGGKVIVDQAIGGDATLAGGSVDVRAAIGDDLRAAGADVSIESTVGGELFAAGASIGLTPAAAIARSATVYGSSIAIDGRIDGDLRATARKIILRGEVRGNARLVAEEIELGPQARIAGALHYESRSELKRAEGAFIGGAVTRGEAEADRKPRAGDGQWERSVQAASWGGAVMSFLALLAAAAVFLLVFPRFGAAASQRIRSTPWLALAVGFATVLAVPVLAVLLFITLLGIPIGIALLALYPALMLAGFVVGVLFVGRMVAAALRKQVPASFAGGMGYFAIALLLMLIVAGVPFVGGLLIGVLVLAGIGACVLELHGRRQAPPGSAPTGRAVPVDPATG